MDGPQPGTPRPKTATAARVWDYILGGMHNFPADQELARLAIQQLPDLPATARANRAVLRRAVRHLTAAGVRQLLDIGSGIPTVGNVHEIAQQDAPDCRVVYVDNDPVAVAESLEILEGNPNAIAILGDLCQPADILHHRALQELLDLGQPTGLLLASVLHFIPDEQAYQAVSELVDALAPGSYLLVTHAGVEQTQPRSNAWHTATADYQRQTTARITPRTRTEVERFFTGLDLLVPGIVELSDWRPDPDEADAHTGQPSRTLGWVGLATKPASV
ncbi:MAG: SAM-dependent methyltransferase [Micromonosporaceae bacterium]|nr:SAM-dependent methyltransferase [Micromonosporaceae bacterium]